MQLVHLLSQKKKAAPESVLFKQSQFLSVRNSKKCHTASEKITNSTFPPPPNYEKLTDTQKTWGHCIFPVYMWEYWLLSVSLDKQ